MSVTSRLKLLAKLGNKEYRDAYVEEKVATSLPFQIRALREQPGREWSQAELGERAGMRQNAISRLEDAESGTPSITTLLRLARAFDVALLVKFVPFSKLLSEFADSSSEALSALSFEQELPQLRGITTQLGGVATYTAPVGSFLTGANLFGHHLQPGETVVYMNTDVSHRREHLVPRSRTTPTSIYSDDLSPIVAEMPLPIGTVIDYKSTPTS